MTAKLSPARLRARETKRKRTRDLKQAAAIEAKRRAEARAEEVSPATQRLGVQANERLLGILRKAKADTEGVVYQAPRVQPDGVSFRRSNPVWHLMARGAVSHQQGEAADRLARSWEDGGRGVGAGCSSYEERASTTPQTGCISDSVLARLGYQNRQKAEFESARASVGVLWPVVRAVVLDGLDVSAWAAETGRNPQAAKGYLLAALDLLVAHYAALRVATEAGPAKMRGVQVVERAQKSY